MNAEWSLLAYRNGDLLGAYIESAYAELSHEIGSRADYWSLRSETTKSEIVQLLLRTDKASALDVAPVPILRPGMRRILGPGKYRGVIAAEISVIAANVHRDFADLLGDFIEPNQTNRALLKRIDRSVVETYDERVVNWQIPNHFSRTFAVWLKVSENSNVSDFCFSIFEEWSGVRDSSLSSKLKEIELESGRTSNDVQ